MAQGPIALFDSGEGGLTVLRQLVQRFPGEHFLYGADSLHFPYGEKPLDAVREWFLAFLTFFLSLDVRAVVIACNTATAAALLEAQHRSPVPVIGVIQPAATKAVKTTKNGIIAVLSTEATFHSGIYPQTLSTLNPRLKIVAKPCPILVVMAENGLIDGKNTEAEVRDCVAPVLSSGADTIILGCTHFPHMARVFARVVGPQAQIVDPGQEIAHQLQPITRTASMGAPNPVIAWTTGDPERFLHVAHKLCPEVPIVPQALSWNLGRIMPQYSRLSSGLDR